MKGDPSEVASSCFPWLGIVPVYAGGILLPFSAIGGRESTDGNGTGSVSSPLFGNDLDSNGERSPLRDSRKTGVDSDSIGGGVDGLDGDSGNGARLANFHLQSDGSSLHRRSSSGLEPQGVSNMDQVFTFLSVASGYVISFAVGAWIGRPLLESLASKILRK